MSSIVTQRPPGESDTTFPTSLRFVTIGVLSVLINVIAAIMTNVNEFVALLIFFGNLSLVIGPLTLYLLLDDSYPLNGLFKRSKRFTLGWLMGYDTLDCGCMVRTDNITDDGWKGPPKWHLETSTRVWDIETEHAVSHYHAAKQRQYRCTQCGRRGNAIVRDNWHDEQAYYTVFTDDLMPEPVFESDAELVGEYASENRR